MISPQHKPTNTIVRTPTAFNNTRYAKTDYLKPGQIRFNIMVKLAGVGHKLLDLGCGDGTFLKMVTTSNPSPEGMEISAQAAQFAQRQGFKITVGDVSGSFPYPDDSFDMVTAGEIIEHIYDTDYFVAEIYRILKPGGSLVISTPNAASFGRRLMLLVGRNPHLEYHLGPRDAGHIRYFTFATLQSLLESHHFKVDTAVSDVVNFDNSGHLCFPFLARLFPHFGASIIIHATKP